MPMTTACTCPTTTACQCGAIIDPWPAFDFWLTATGQQEAFEADPLETVEAYTRFWDDFKVHPVLPGMETT